MPKNLLVGTIAFRTTCTLSQSIPKAADCQSLENVLHHRPSVTTLISALDNKGVLGNESADAGVKSEATATSVVSFTYPQKAHQYITRQPFSSKIER